MHDGIHQHQDEQYPRPDQERLLEDNTIVDPKSRDVTEDESIRELENSAGSEEGIGVRDEDGLHLNMDVKEDREDNNEGRLPDIPPSAIKQ